ncbi:MAG: DUF1580 domain-containing protein [Pirellulales bacterium]
MVSLPVAPPAERISLPKLASAEGVSPVTVWRWALRGVKGVKLRTGCIGGSIRYTTRQWYEEFCERVTAARSGDPAPAPRTKSREAAIDRAEKQLAEMGV